MSSDWQVLTTGRRPDPVGFWLDAVRNSILDADFATREAQFQGTMNSRQHHDVRLINFSNSPHNIVRRSARSSCSAADSLILSLQRQGSAHIVQGETEGVAETGDICLLDTTRCFKIRFPHFTQRSLVVLPRHTLGAQVPSMLRAFGPTFIRRDDDLAPLIKELMFALTNHQRDTHGQSLDALLGALASALGMHFSDTGIATPAITEPSFELVKRQIHRHLADPSLSAVKVAAACRLSVRTLHRLFARHGDTTFEEFVISSRLSMAHGLLKSGASKTVTETAFACGFNNPSHFTKRFSERFGHPPSHILKRQ